MIDAYVPLSNAQNPSLQTLVNGWLEPATEASNPGAYTVIGGPDQGGTLGLVPGLEVCLVELRLQRRVRAAARCRRIARGADPVFREPLGAIRKAAAVHRDRRCRWRSQRLS